MIGKGQFMLQSLANMIDNPSEIVLIGTNYLNHGSLKVNIVPTDQYGNFDEDDEDLYVDSPEEMIQRGRLDFAVEIDRAQNLPANFCKNVYVEYQIYLNDEVYRTPIIQGKERNP